MKKKTTLFFVIYVFVLMFFCSGASPFVDYMSIDGSVFFAIGRGMASGKTAYLELFDHKGWYIYFFNYLGALISSSGTIGIFIVESIFFLMNTIVCYYIGKLYFKNEYERMLFSMGMLLAALNLITYAGGNKIESYALTFQLLSILLILRYARSGKITHPPVYMFIHGVCVGIVFNLRANMIMMWGAIALVVIIYLLVSREYRNALANILMGALGVLVGMLPPVIYGLCTGSLGEMIEQSILFNLAYSEGSGFLRDAVNAFRSMGGLTSLVLGSLSLIIVLRSREQKPVKIMYVLALLLSAVSVSMSGRGYGHYFEYFIPLFIPLGVWIIKQLKIGRLIHNKKRWSAAVCIFFVLTICVNLCTPIRLFIDTGVKRSIQTSIEVSQLFRERYPEGGTVLVTNNNARYYNKMNVIPHIKHFYTPSIGYDQYPHGVDEQIESILSGKNDVVVVEYADFKNGYIYAQGFRNEEILQYLEQNYHLIYDKEKTQVWEKNPIGA